MYLRWFQVANEIAEAISNPVGFGSAIDDDDLLAELNALEQEELDKQLIEVSHTFVTRVLLVTRVTTN